MFEARALVLGENDVPEVSDGFGDMEAINPLSKAEKT